MKTKPMKPLGDVGMSIPHEVYSSLSDLRQYLHNLDKDNGRLEMLDYLLAKYDSEPYKVVNYPWSVRVDKQGDRV